MILNRTPFRLPLGGGGTDLPSYYSQYGGFLVTAAINKYMYIHINRPALVHKIKVNYSKTEIVEHPDEIKHELVRESLKLLGIGAPIEIHSMADVSAGTGLGSSSAYTVGLLNGLTRLIRHFMSIQELAEMACHIEIERVGKPIGKQDQYASAFGGIIALEIEKNGKVHVTPIEMHEEVIRDFENNLMMFYTHIERDANEILKEETKKIKNSGSASQNPGKNSEEAVQALHQIKEIGYRSRDALLTGDVEAYGKLLHEHWQVKKRISSKMSSPEIDKWYELAMNNGAIGGKIMGAGGGGFFLFCVENGRRRHLRAVLEQAGLRYMDFRFDFEGSRVLVNI